MSEGSDDRGLPPPEGPLLPDAEERMPCRWVDPPHPSLLPPDELSARCRFRAQRRSGPGGQHRNKTSSGVFLEHLPTEIVAEATERRSQAQNRARAFERLRWKLAIEVRTPSVLAVDSSSHESADAGEETRAGGSALEIAVRNRFRGSPLRIASTNHDHAAVLALILNDLHAAGGQPSLVADRWSVSTSSIVSFLKRHRPAFEWVNEVRAHHGRLPLR